jgi:hypothetical protein
MRRHDEGERVLSSTSATAIEQERTMPPTCIAQAAQAATPQSNFGSPMSRSSRKT